MQPGTVPIGVATGIFNNSDGGLLDFAVLEQISSSGSYQVEIFHGASNGTFCTNCNSTNPNPDLIPLGSGVKGNAIAVGQFRSSGPTDIAVATNNGIVFLENNDTGTFSIGAYEIASTNGFVALTVGLFNGDSIPDIAAVAPAGNAGVSFSVFFGNGDGTFSPSASYPVSSPWIGCSEIMPGNFQNQATGSDLALLCRTPSAAGVLVYLNTGSSRSYSYFYISTPYSAAIGGGVLPTPAVGTLNGQGTIFVSAVASSFSSYQSNGAGVFTSVSMVPVGLAPHGPLAILSDTSAAVDFASGPSVSTFTSYTQSGAFVDGTWNSTGNLGPVGQTIATGSSNLMQGTTYMVIDAGTAGGSYSDPNVTGLPNLVPYVDERSVSVYPVTLNGDGTVKSAITAPIYSGTGGSGSTSPTTFATGDFNGDGVMDLAVGGAIGTTGDTAGNATVTIYLANSDGSLPSTTSLPVVTVNNTNFNGTDAVAAGKFRPAQNGKALYDLAVFSFGEIAIFTSNGDGTFNVGNTYFLSGDTNYPGFSYNPGGGHSFAPVLTATDVNGDGFDDIVLTLPEDNCSASGSPSQGAVYILISNGDGTFQNPVFVAPPVQNPVSVAAARLFGSSLPDLVFANGGEICRGNTAPTKANEVAVLQNKVTPGATTISAADFTLGVISSSTQSTDPGTPNVTSVASGDFNGDGFPDLVVSNINGIQILLNSGTGSFSPTAQGVVPLYAGDAIPGLLCNSLDGYTGCITNDAQVATGSFFAGGETDVAAAVSGVVYVFQNNSGTLAPPTQGFVAGMDSRTISGALTGPKGLNGLLIATSNGIANLSNSGSAGGPAIATFVPSAYATSIDFGTVEIGQSSPDKILELFNGGTGPLHLYLISLIDTSSQTIQSAPFVLNSIFCNASPGAPVSIQEPVSSIPNLTLQPGIACDFLMTMQPTAQGTYTGTFNFLDNAAQTNAPIQQPNGQNFAQTIQLTGTAPPGQPYATFTANGVSVPSNALILQGVPINTTQSSQITVTNTGNGLLTLDLVYFNLLPPSTANGFSYTQVLCGGTAANFPVTLLPNQSCTVNVLFTATVGGTFSTNLYFLDNAGAGESNITSGGTAPNFIQAYSLSATVTTPTADVSIIGESGPSQTPTTGSPFVFTLGLLNNGPDVATNPVVTFSFSSPVFFDSLSIQGGFTPNCLLPAVGSSVTSFTCKYSGASLVPGFPEITALTITPTTSGNFTLTSTISADQIDPNLSNNTSHGGAFFTAPTPPAKPGPVSSVYFSPTLDSPVPSGNAPSAIAVADFNKDGNTDFAVVNTKDNTVSIYLGDSIGTFTQAAGSPYSTTPFGIANTETPISIAVGDFDGDGNLDIAVTTIPTGFFSAFGNLFSGHVGGGVSILLGNGDGTFRGGGQFNNPNNFGTGGDLPTGIAVADLNGDGHPDLAITNLNSNNVSILLGDGKGNFGSPTLIPVGSHPAAVTTFLTGTGLPNLAIANAEDGTVGILMNLGAASFRPGVGSPINVGTRPVAIASGDVNGDGKSDLVVANYSSSSVSVLMGNGNGTFAAAKNFPAGVHPMSVAVADLNYDGLPDVLVANNTGNQVSLLAGHGDGTFAAPKNFSVLQAPSAIALGNFGGSLGFAALSTTLDSVGVYAGNVSCIPVALGLTISKNSGWSFPPRSTVASETLTITNEGGTSYPGPIYLVVSNLSSNATLNNPTGFTRCSVAAASPYIAVPGALVSGASVTVTVQVSDPSRTAISFTPVYLAPGPAPFIP